MSNKKYKVGDIIKLETRRNVYKLSEEGEREIIWDKYIKEKYFNAQDVYNINCKIALIQKENGYYIVLVTSPNVAFWKTRNAGVFLNKEEKEYLDKNYPDGKFWGVYCDDVIVGLHKKCSCKFAK